MGEPGVEVTGAGNDGVNGWYVRKKKAEGPPRGWPDSQEDWNWPQQNLGRYWYEKDDGCFIHRNGYRPRCWDINSPTGRTRYYCRVPAGQLGVFPPAQGWDMTSRRCPGGDGRAPAPTLRVVN